MRSSIARSVPSVVTVFPRRSFFLRIARVGLLGGLTPLVGLGVLGGWELFVGIGARSACASPAELVVPKADGLVLDGKGAEPAWEGAAALTAEALEGTTPTVRLLASGGRLWVLAEMAEDVGFPIGLKLMLCPEGTLTAADTTQLAFGPQEIRAARFVARGPRGVGRAKIRLEGAADVQSLGRWSVEVSIPFEDLGLATDTTSVRLAAVVMSRRLNRFATAPAGSAFQSPTTFAKLAPPEGGWSSAGKAVVDAEAIAKADQADEARMAAWREFVQAQTSGAVQIAEAREKLVAPLDRVIAARPDLAMAYVVKGNILQELGDPVGAKAAYASALAAVPNLPEAAWATAVLDIAAYSEGTETTPSDYPAALARIAEEAKKRGGPSVALEAAEGVLRYRLGEFPAAIKLLDPIVAHYPVDDELASKLTFARKYGELFAQELGLREADAKKGDLPRAKIVTSKGPVVVELFEDDCPNSVANFLWLAKHRFYDGLRFHRVLPYFMVQGGDPYSPSGDPRLGSGGPGYAIKTEASRRRPFRGMLAMANAGKDTEGSQFFVTTGTSAHLEGSFSIFGRVLEGQDVVDRIVRGDRIETVEIVRSREHEYRPATVAGTPAPEPYDPPGTTRTPK